MLINCIISTSAIILLQKLIFLQIMRAKKPPFEPDKIYQHALYLHNEGKLKEAEGLYKMLLDFFPDQVEVISALAALLLQLGQQEKGIALLKKSLSLNPLQPSALFNLGIELQKQTLLEEALQRYDQALALNPKDINVLINRGNTLKDLKQYRDAISSFERALSIQPSSASAHWNKALTHLLIGEYEQGWREYEWGWECGERGRVRKFTQPVWLGEESISGKTIFVYREQGLGDLIQFSRYLPLLEKQGAQVILEAPASLISLMRSISKTIIVLEDNQPLPYFDFVCPVMSLPLAFKTTIDSIPAEVPYVTINQDKKKVWREKLGVKTKPRVGVVWSGSMTNKIDLNPCARRNIPLEQLKTIFELPLEFHALQKEFRPEDEALIVGIKNIQLHQYELHDFSDTAALIQEMDLIVSVCTSVTHLAGSLNQPAWVLLPYSADYRWMLNANDSKWYPSIKLIRQTKINDHTGQVKELLKGLKAKFSV